MKDLYSLINRRNQLPKGFVYKKTINGKDYFYHQYSLNGQKFTRIVKSEELDQLQKDIEERVTLDKEIKELLKGGKRNITLSIMAKEMTGSVMSENKVVATFEKGVLLDYNEALCPLIIKRTKSLEPFLKCRVIDNGRTNSRLLKKALNINERDDTMVSLCSYAASISDNYWFKPKHSKLKYEDVCFNNDLFFDTALKGIMAIYPNKMVITPELTTGGGYEKGWKNINGQWWLYKVGTENEIFSELFYAHLFELLDLPTAHYEYEEGFIKSKNFADGYNFEPIISIAGEDDSYEHVFNVLEMLNHQIAKDYLRLCFFDVVLNNIDRHNENCGILRDKENGNIISLAPNYDDNLSLISRNDQLVMDPKEGFLKVFVALINKNSNIKKALKESDIPVLTTKIINKCLDDLPIKRDKEMIINYVMLRYETLMKAINN